MLSPHFRDFKSNLHSLEKLLQLRTSIFKSQACLIDGEELFSSTSSDSDSVYSSCSCHHDHHLLLSQSTSLGILASSPQFISSTSRSVSILLNSEITQSLSSLSKILEEKMKSVVNNTIGKNVVKNDKNKNHNNTSLLDWSREQSRKYEHKELFRILSKTVRIIGETLNLLRRRIFELGDDFIDDDGDDRNNKTSAKIENKSLNHLTLFDDAVKNRERNSLFCFDYDGENNGGIQQKQEEENSGKKENGNSSPKSGSELITPIEMSISAEKTFRESILLCENNNDNFYQQQQKTKRNLSAMQIVDWLEQFIDVCEAEL